MKKILEAKNINKTYPGVIALDNVNFNVYKAKVNVLVGENGAGKSTLMKIITCYLPANEGEVKVCGEDVQKDSLSVRSKVGYLPEQNPMYLEMYIKEYLEFVAGVYNSPKERVSEMIELTGLTPEQHKKIGELSKGYRQRVGLAAALIHNPEVLILDEPTTGLDPNQLAEIRALIKEIGKEKTVLLSTHIMQEVDKMCSRVVIINKGEIVDDQSISSLQEKGVDLETHFRKLTQ